MKQFLFLFTCLLMACGATIAQTYDSNEIEQLKVFLSQDSKIEGKKNIDILFEDCPSNWADDATVWVRNINVVWGNVDGTMHVQSIDWVATTSSVEYRLSGALHLENFIELTWFLCSGQALSELNLINCKKLKMVEASSNLLTSVDLTGCNALETINLNHNYLLFSKVTLPEPGIFSLTGNKQNVFYFSSNKAEANEFDVDLTAEFPHIGEAHWLADSAYAPSLIIAEEIRPKNEANGIYTFNINRLYQNLSGILTHKTYSEFQVKIDVVPASARIVVNITNVFDKDQLETISLHLFDHEGTRIDMEPILDDAFYFQALAPGKYILWAETSQTGTKYLPTYYRADGLMAPSWKEASVITITHQEQREDISIRFNEEPPQNPGDITISGKITDGSAAKAQVSRSASVGVYRSKEQAKSMLKSNDLVLVKIVYPDNQGNYSFSGLPAGQYFVIPDIAGYSVTPIEIDAQSGKLYQGKDFVVNDENKTITPNIVMATPELQGVKLTIYPNPATDVIHITGLQDAYIIKIMNAVGQMVKQVTGQSPEAILNVGNQPSGLYLVRIEAGGKSTTCKLIKK